MNGRSAPRSREAALAPLPSPQKRSAPRQPHHQKGSPLKGLPFFDRPKHISPANPQASPREEAVARRRLMRCPSLRSTPQAHQIPLLFLTQPFDKLGQPPWGCPSARLPHHQQTGLYDAVARLPRLTQITRPAAFPRPHPKPLPYDKETAPPKTEGAAFIVDPMDPLLWPYLARLRIDTTATPAAASATIISAGSAASPAPVLGEASSLGTNGVGVGVATGCSL